MSLRLNLPGLTLMFKLELALRGQVSWSRAFLEVEQIGGELGILLLESMTYH